MFVIGDSHATWHQPSLKYVDVVNGTDKAKDCVCLAGRLSEVHWWPLSGDAGHDRRMRNKTEKAEKVKEDTRI